jgi:hypothetical protein
MERIKDPMNAASNTVLTKENAPRVAVIKNIENPDWGTFCFNYRSQPLAEHGKFTHSCGSGFNSRILDEDEFHLWEVFRWK